MIACPGDVWSLSLSSFLSVSFLFSFVLSFHVFLSVLISCYLAKRMKIGANMIACSGDVWGLLACKSQLLCRNVKRIKWRSNNSVLPSASLPATAHHIPNTISENVNIYFLEILKCISMKILICISFEILKCISLAFLQHISLDFLIYISLEILHCEWECASSD